LMPFYNVMITLKPNEILHIEKQYNVVCDVGG